MRFVYFLVFGLVFLTGIYWLVQVYSRSVRRERLEERWDSEHPGGDRAERDAYVEAGMIKYESGFRRKLIILVYVLPILSVAAIVILTN